MWYIYIRFRKENYWCRQKNSWYQQTWLKKTDYNAKITEIECKIPNISGLATTAALNAVENKIPDVGNLVKKTDYDTKLLDIESI